MPTLNLYGLTLAYSDAVTNNNPGLRNIDWKRSIQNLAVENPATVPHKVGASTETTCFDATRSTGVDSTTAFTLSLSTQAPDLYRVSWTGGTDPVLRTARSVTTNGVALTLTVQGNGSLLLTAGTGTPFATTQAGDELMISGTLTGDSAGVFNALNQGRWTVLAIGSAGANVTLARPAGTEFQGASEVVTPADNTNLTVYGQVGVQPGDTVVISGGFAAVTQKTYEVEDVTSGYFEVRSSLPLPAESSITPHAAGISFFADGKRYIQVEVDQQATLRINGVLMGADMVPWMAGDPQQVASFSLTGPVYSLGIVNKSTSTLNAVVMSAE